ncbi:uncharacterized protein TRUGW13939_06635 [Talaromyces rugulosus]|uniref:Zn(2)-C6 fungal-type domain-containing protein n=1 Tax=Talaromyces rugulosus TaxID=121627 RepID=A0A7H8R1E5_TALRU|nr:uncharacterized protein TRUGW13939_06635 [Talaromyces rugulosus]QKX59501.1 hypothetical protein TRUGW13939_06635 [Talaromyces rugulosus]
MPSRRTHLKRRHGCLVCKARKVKCDLQRPACSHCSKRGEYCVYNTDEYRSIQFIVYMDNSKSRGYDYGAPYRSNNVLLTPSPSPPSSHTHTHIPCYSPLPRHVFNTELSLLEHYTSRVSFTLTDREDVQNLYASLVVDMSFEKTFLAHSILATAAVHKMHTESMTEDQLSHCQYLSLHHQNAAMALIRLQVADLTAENCEALYISAGLIFILNLTCAPLANPSMMIDRFVELCELARGAGAVIEQSSPTLKTGRLKAFFNFVKWDHPMSGSGDQPARTPLSAKLEKTVESLPSEMDHLKDIYRAALRCLNITITAVIANRAHPAIIFMWFVILDRQYITLVAARDWVALQILECYGEYARCLPERWWSRQWGRDLVLGVRCVLENQNETNISSFQSQELETCVTG